MQDICKEPGAFLEGWSACLHICQLLGFPILQFHSCSRKQKSEPQSTHTCQMKSQNLKVCIGINLPDEKRNHTESSNSLQCNPGALGQKYFGITFFNLEQSTLVGNLLLPTTGVELWVVRFINPAHSPRHSSVLRLIHRLKQR